jgi:peptidoglycan/LPS O-acetylase OafA/YrhL
VTVARRGKPIASGLRILDSEGCASPRVELEPPAPRGNIKALAPERRNAFDLIRLLLAVAVVYSHAHLLGGFGEEGFSLLCKGQTFAGSLAVIGFFGISGFLVAQSFSARGDAWQFVKARLLRIVPGFYFALVVTAYVLAPLIARFNPLGSPWQNAAAAHFVVGNALVDIASWNIGNILNGLPFPGSLNGALWSLFPEICCYGLVLAFGALGWFKAGRANIVLFFAGVAALHASLILSAPVPNIAPTLLALTGWAPYIAAFLTGSSIFCYRDSLGIGGKSAMGWLLASVVLLKFGGWALLGPSVLPLALINTAYSFRARLPFDLSYGTYVLHFPVLHLLAAMGLNHQGFTAYFGLGLVVSFAMAFVSWYAVERPFLKLKSKAAAGLDPT